MPEPARPDRWHQVSQSPTRPTGGPPRPRTAEDLFAPAVPTTPPLDEKLRQAYFWLVNRAVISPFYDVEFSADAPVTFTLGGDGPRPCTTVSRPWSPAPPSACPRARCTRSSPTSNAAHWAGRCSRPPTR